MRQVIFSKYSNERNRKLAIRTDICQEEDGKRFVCKLPVYEEGRAHILKLSEWEQALSRKYDNTPICFNHGDIEENKICFEYLEGETLESLLDKLWEEKKYEQFFDCLHQFISEIKKVNTQKFVMTDQFKEVFGDVVIETEETAADINNIDMIATNVIINDGTWTVIDFEWTFDFPIPTSFIIYRFIYYYADALVKREVMQKHDLYQMFGISESKIELYRQMEQNFQKYVTKGVFSLKQMYGGISKGILPFEKQKGIEVEKQQAIKVYYDEGNGFSEDNTEYFMPLRKERGEENIQKFWIGVKGDSQELRIDPLEEPCLVKINRLIGKADYTYELQYETNGYCFDEDTYLFMDNDPWIRVTDLKKGIVQINFSMEIEPLKPLFAESLYLELDKKRMLAEEAERQKNQQIGEVNAKLHLAEVSLREIENSFCWKITKPIRMIGMAIRTIMGRRS